MRFMGSSRRLLAAYRGACRAKIGYATTIGPDGNPGPIANFPATAGSVVLALTQCDPPLTAVTTYQIAASWCSPQTTSKAVRFGSSIRSRRNRRRRATPSTAIPTRPSASSTGLPSANRSATSGTPGVGWANRSPAAPATAGRDCTSSKMSSIPVRRTRRSSLAASSGGRGSPTTCSGPGVDSVTTSSCNRAWIRAPTCRWRSCARRW